MQSTSAASMGTEGMLSPQETTKNYLNAASIRAQPLQPLDRLAAIEVEAHLKAPRAQFAFLADIRKFREEKARKKYMDMDGEGGGIVSVLKPKVSEEL